MVSHSDFVDARGATFSISGRDQYNYYYHGFLRALIIDPYRGVVLPTLLLI